MLRFLSAEALYGLLLVTTFASVGLLGLWAANSRWHPFLRTTIVLAILSILLLRPMFEPFVTLVSQVAAIAAGVAAHRWVKNRKQIGATDAKKTRYQFSLRTLLFVSTLAALGAAVWAKLPEMGYEAWLGIGGIGALAGVGTLLTAYVAVGSNWWRRLLAAVGAIVSMGFVIGPPWMGIAAFLVLYDYVELTLPIVVAASTAFAGFHFLLLLAVIGVWRRSTLTSYCIVPKSRTASTLAIAFTVLLVGLPAYFAWELLNPLPLPPRNEMVPNAYHELIAIALIFERSPLWAAYVADPPNMNDIALEVANHADQFNLLHEVLGEPSVIPDSVSNNEDYDLRRILVYVLGARADAEREAGNTEASLQACADTLLLAQALQGGLVVDFLTTSPIEGTGVQGIYQLKDRLDEAQCESAIEALLNCDANRESADEIGYRDRQSDENTYGWYWHLAMILNDLSGRNATHKEDVLYSPFAKRQAVLRLLAADLALRRYKLANGTLPDRLDQLVPDILPEVPRDPFDPAGGTLRYKRSGDSYLLYNVGENNADDGGTRPTPFDLDSLGMEERLRHRSDGDLRLDVHFGKE